MKIATTHALQTAVVLGVVASFSFSTLTQAQSSGPDLTISPNPPGTLTAPTIAIQGVPTSFAIEIENIGTSAAYNPTHTFVAEMRGPTPGTSLDAANSVVTQGDYAYVVSRIRDSLAVIDITDPVNPVFKTELRFTTTNYLDGAFDIALQGNYAYIANFDRDSLAVIDISDPLNPVFKSELRAANSYLDKAQAVTVSGNYAYVVTYRPSLESPAGSENWISQASLVIIDISNPLNPTKASQLEHTGHVGHVGSLAGRTGWENLTDVAVKENYAYVTDRDGWSFGVIDISNPASPTFVTELQGSTYDGISEVFISGNYAYVTMGIGDSFGVIDISNPLSPTLIGTTQGPTPGTSLDGASESFVDGGYAYVATANRDSLAVINVSDPASPTFVVETRGTTPGTSLDNAQSVVVQDGYAYVANFNRDSLAVIDISESFKNVLKMSSSADGSSPTSLATADAGPLSAGEITSGFSISYTPTDMDIGNRYFQICADEGLAGDKSITEEDETNNCTAWTPITVSFPIPECSTFTVTPGSLLYGEGVDVAWSCSNSSSCTAVDNPVGFTTGGATSGSQASIIPSPGINQRFGVICAQQATGTEFTIYSDPFDVIEPDGSIIASPPQITSLTSSTINASCTGSTYGSVVKLGGGIKCEGAADGDGNFSCSFNTGLGEVGTYRLACDPPSGGDPVERDARVQFKVRFRLF